MTRKTTDEFEGLLTDLDQADARILHLFPSLDFHASTFDRRIKLGLKTRIRALIVAAEHGYVNEYLLLKQYQVGGESRHRALVLLQSLGLLRRTKETSEKNVTRFRYTLSDKGVVFCTAFPRLFRSGRYAALITKRVSNENLARVMLVLYLYATGDTENRLLSALRHASDSGLNLEHVPEDLLAEKLLEGDELLSRSSGADFLFRAFEVFIDFHQSAKPSTRAYTKQSIDDLVDFAFSQPKLALRFLALAKEALELFRSTDFQVWLRLTHSSPKEIMRLQQHLGKLILARLGDIGADNSIKARKLWEKRHDILEEVRNWLREEILWRTSELHRGLAGRNED
jgi:hypothetical protein